MSELHVILDIDQTMIDNMSMSDYNKHKLNLRKPDLIDKDMCIWMRPNLVDFLKFLDKNVKYISIWTNGSTSWLFFVVKNIISKHIPHNRFHLLLSIEHSTPFVVDNVKMHIKDTNNILQKFLHKKISLKNTLLIDDNYFNCIYNKFNSLPIKKYFIMHEEKCKNDLQFIKQIITVLKRSNDVSKTLKNVYNGVEDYNKLFTLQ